MMAVGLLLTLLVGCQWVAWRFHWPAIVLLTVCGIMLGPVTGLLHPKVLMGDYYFGILISVAVAVILFDGGLNLRFKELRNSKRAVHQVIWIGGPIGWVLNTLAAHYIGGLSWETSWVFGGILVVTGPTVIIPLLRQAKLQPRVASVLKWEGIVNDPIGAIYAVLAMEHFLTIANNADAGISSYIVQILAVSLIVACSWGFARILIWCFVHGYVPDYLKPLAVLACVVLAYAFTNSVHHEGGLLAVTVLGITLANTTLQGMSEIRHFKETISILLVSLIFIMITATLDWPTLGKIDGWGLLFIISVLFITRPLTIFLSTIGSGLTLREKIFLGWIAPRGVVCAVISGFFGAHLVANGIADGDKLVPLAFGVVFATVVLHGFTVRPLGEKLQLTASKQGGLIIAGSSPWSVELGKLLHSRGVNLLVVDENWHHLRLAKQSGLPVYYGELLADHIEMDLEIHQYTHLLAATDNFAFNSLLCAKYSHEFGRENVYQLAGDSEDRKDPRAVLESLSGRPFLSGLSDDAIDARLAEGWTFRATKLTEEFTFADYQAQNKGNVIPAVSIQNENISVYSDSQKLIKPTSSTKEMTLISLVKVPKEVVAEKEQKEKEQKEKRNQAKENEEKNQNS